MAVTVNVDVKVILEDVKMIGHTQTISRLREAQKGGMLVAKCEFDDPVSRKRIDTLKDRDCMICRHVLYLSGVTCECTPGKVLRRHSINDCFFDHNSTPAFISFSLTHTLPRSDCLLASRA